MAGSTSSCRPGLIIPNPPSRQPVPLWYGRASAPKKQLRTRLSEATTSRNLRLHLWQDAERDQDDR